MFSDKNGELTPDLDTRFIGALNKEVNHHPYRDNDQAVELWTIFHSCGRAHHKMVISLIIEYLPFISEYDLYSTITTRTMIDEMIGSLPDE